MQLKTLEKNRKLMGSCSQVWRGTAAVARPSDCLSLDRVSESVQAHCVSAVPHTITSRALTTLGLIYQHILWISRRLHRGVGKLSKLKSGETLDHSSRGVSKTAKY